MVEKASTQQRAEPLGLRLSSPGERERHNAYGHKSGGQNIAVMFGLQLPLIVEPHTTLSNLANKLRGIYFVKQVFARLLFIASVCIQHIYVYVYISIFIMWVYDTICLDYVLRTSIYRIKENGFNLKKVRSRRYPSETITNADYADDLALPANIHTLLHNLEKAAGGISLYVNAKKKSTMSFNWKETISAINGGPLKLGNKFNYLGSSVSSPEIFAKRCRGLLSISFQSYRSLIYLIEQNRIPPKPRLSQYYWIDAPRGRW